MYILKVFTVLKSWLLIQKSRNQSVFVILKIQFAGKIKKNIIYELLMKFW